MKKYKIVLTIIFLSSLLLFFCLFLFPRKEINVQIASGFLPQQQLSFLPSAAFFDEFTSSISFIAVFFSVLIVS